MQPIGSGVGSANVRRRYLLELKPPPGWQVPDAPTPRGAIRLTLGGQPPASAPASMMVRAVDKEADVSFEDYCRLEFEAMLRTFPDGRLVDVVGVDFPEQRWIAKQIVTSEKGAILTIVDAGDHFIWFGLMMNDTAQLARGPELYRRVLASFHERPANPFGEPQEPLPV